MIIKNNKKLNPPSSSSSTSKWVVQIVSFFVSEIERNKSTGNFHKNVFQQKDGGIGVFSEKTFENSGDG